MIRNNEAPTVLEHGTGRDQNHAHAADDLESISRTTGRSQGSIRRPSPGIEVSPFATDRGELIGKDPREITSDEWLELRDKKADYQIGLKAVRANCLDCCNDSPSEVRKCTFLSCALWPFRMGSVPRGYREAVKRAVK